MRLRHPPAPDAHQAHCHGHARVRPVVVEPSGIFDVDEFFDILRDDPLDRWYQLGSVIAIVDALLPETLSPQAEYVLASETANAGRVLVSRTQLPG